MQNEIDYDVTSKSRFMVPDTASADFKADSPGLLTLSHCTGRVHADPALGSLGRWLLMATFATSPISYLDPRQELLRSGNSANTWVIRRSRGQRITLQQAREIALQVFAETEVRLNEERIAESRFLLQPWDDEEVSPR